MYEIEYLLESMGWKLREWLVHRFILKLKIKQLRILGFDFKCQRAMDGSIQDLGLCALL